MNGFTQVHFNAIDLSPYIRSVGHDPKDHPTAHAAGLHNVTMTVRGRFNPDVYRAMFGYRRARVRRMRAAYGRRRGRGRW